MGMEKVGLGRFYGVGTGPGDPGLLTVRAVEVLRRVEVIFAAAARDQRSFAGGVIKALGGCRAECRNLPFTMAREMADRARQWRENAAAVAAELKKGRDCAFVTIGDPLLYSTYTYLLREVRALLPAVEVGTVPGIMAFQDLAARFSLPTVEDRETLLILPAWDRERDFCRKLENADTVVLMKTTGERRALLDELQAAGFSGEIVYGSRLGQEGEELARGAEGIAAAGENYLSLILAKRRPERTASGGGKEGAAQ